MFMKRVQLIVSMCYLWIIADHISQVIKSAWHKKAQHLLKCKTIRNIFKLNRMMQGCGISRANEGGAIILYYRQNHQRRDSTKLFAR